MTIIDPAELKMLHPQTFLFSMRHHYFWVDRFGLSGILKKMSGAVAISHDEDGCHPLEDDEPMMHLWLTNSQDHATLVRHTMLHYNDSSAHFVHRLDLCRDEWEYIEEEFPELATQMKRNCLHLPLTGYDWQEVYNDDDDNISAARRIGLKEYICEMPYVPEVYAQESFECLIEENLGIVGLFYFDENTNCIFFEIADDMEIARRTILEAFGLEAYKIG